MCIVSCISQENMQNSCAISSTLWKDDVVWVWCHVRLSFNLFLCRGYLAGGESELNEPNIYTRWGEHCFGLLFYSALYLYDQCVSVCVWELVIYFKAICGHTLHVLCLSTKIAPFQDASDRFKTGFYFWNSDVFVCILFLHMKKWWSQGFALWVCF